MKRLLLITVIVLMASVGVLGHFEKPALAAPIKLGAVSALPSMVDPFKPLTMLIDKVKSRSKGELIIEYKGGAEVVAPPDQAIAVRKGGHGTTSPCHMCSIASRKTPPHSIPDSQLSLRLHGIAFFEACAPEAGAPPSSAAFSFFCSFFLIIEMMIASAAGAKKHAITYPLPICFFISLKTY